MKLWMKKNAVNATGESIDCIMPEADGTNRIQWSDKSRPEPDAVPHPPPGAGCRRNKGV
jgi:hypothetical protein